MYEGILDALIRLFILISDQEPIRNRSHARNILHNYLARVYDTDVVSDFLNRFDQYTAEQDTLAQQPCEIKESTNDKLRKVCEAINESFELSVKQQIVMRLFEFVEEFQGEEELVNSSIDVIKEGLQLEGSEFADIRHFSYSSYSEIQNKDRMLIVSGSKEDAIERVHFIYNEGQRVSIRFLYIASSSLLLIHYRGQRNLYMNGHKLTQGRVQVVPQGAIMKTSRMRPLYYNGILSIFIHNKSVSKIAFQVEEVEYRFSKNVIGVHPFSMMARSGELVGIMGGSGVGKSTLLNLLSGNLKPESGKILVNGYDLQKEKEELNGVIGFVPQDDLLIEELTVYENLYYNAKLCFGGKQEADLKKIVEKALIEFDLLEAKDLRVGSSVKRIISGGQRKRLNLSLELMREPSILFVDEPTSGLSSSDSEKVMFLLKRQCGNGSIVFANIHQPSSDIYKLFDKLLVLDKGGRVIYQGNPLDAVTYFKEEAHYLNPDESECQSCGNVKTDQPLRIVETRMVSPLGKQIRRRKVGAAEWYDRYKEKIEPQALGNMEEGRKKSPLPPNAFKVPSRRGQTLVFAMRDFYSKLANRQYLAIALLQAPLLALLLSFFIKYTEPLSKYYFAKNVNIPAYLFMSVVVSLFIGLTVSAEEIFKDRRILKREKFLNLSRSSYLSSKVIMLFGISAFQTLSYVIVGNTVLGVEDLGVSYWLILFSASCFANLLGLNLSSGMSSAVAIYISIPFLLVPQLLFSGVVVSFKHMNPEISSREYTPVVGDVMAARWVYEALAVNQYKNNAYEKPFFQDKMKKYGATFMSSHYLPALTGEVQKSIEGLQEGNEKQVKRHAEILEKSLAHIKENYQIKGLAFDASNPEESDLRRLERDLQQEVKKQKEIRDQAERSIRGTLAMMEGRKGGDHSFYFFKLRKHNERLEYFIRDRQVLNPIALVDGKYIQDANHIYQPSTHSFGRSHFYAPYKNFLGFKITTPVFNVLVLWVFILVLGVALYYEWLKRIIGSVERYRKRRKALRDEKALRR